MAEDSSKNSRAALEQVNAVTLPKIYREIGRRVAKSPKVPAVLKHHFDSIARLKPAADAQDAAAVAELREVYAALGQEAVERYGDKAVPKDLAPLLANALADKRTKTEEYRQQPQAKPRSRQRRSPLIAFAVFAAAVAAACVVGVVLWPKAPRSAVRAKDAPATAAQPSPAMSPEPPVENAISRQFFDTQIVTGLTMDEVRRLLGPPDGTTGSATRLIWEYDRVKDETTGKGCAFVSFDRQTGRVEGVGSAPNNRSRGRASAQSRQANGIDTPAQPQRPHSPNDLSVEQAQRLLVANDQQDIYLEDHVTIGSSAAKVLSRHNGHLYLTGVDNLSTDAAAALASHRGWRLFLDGLKTLTPDAAAKLTLHYGVLGLNGLRELPDAVAEALSQPGDIMVLSLNGLTTLSPSAAASLSQGGFSVLGLNGLTELPDAVADALSGFRGNIGMEGVKAISTHAAGRLAQVEGDLFLNGLTTLSEDAAKALAKHSGMLTLKGLRTISAGALEQIKKHRDVSLPSEFIKK